MPPHLTGTVNGVCVYCGETRLVCIDPKHSNKKVFISNCCGGPVCGGEFCTHVCQFCKIRSESSVVRKTGFPFGFGFVNGPFVSAFQLTWEEWFRRLSAYSALSMRPGFREFLG